VWSHDTMGSMLLVVLPLFVLFHIVGRAGLRPRALEVGLSCLRRFAFIVTALFVTALASQVSRLCGAGVGLIALAIFERAVRDRRRAARLVDVSVVAVYLAGLATASEPGLVRMPLIATLLLVQCEAAAFAREVMRLEGEALSRWGALSIAFACALLPFSVLLHSSPTASAYGKSFSIYTILHVVTTTAFVVALVAHIRSVAKKMSAARRPPPVFSWPTFLAGLVAITGWQLGASAALRWHYAPPARVGAARIQAMRVSPYSRVEGYAQFAWDERLLQPAKSCGHAKCHAEVTEQHELSAHGRAFTNDAFQFQLAQFVRDKGPADADYCIACHAPIGVITHLAGEPGSPALDPSSKDLAFNAGITCIVCHRSTPETHRERTGNVSLIIRPLDLESDRYLGAGESSPSGDELHRRLIKLAPELHRRTYRIDHQAADAVCAACHVYVLPGSLSADGKDHLVSDEYSSFADSPYARAGLTCASCHQPQFTNYEDGYPMVDHHYLGSGSSLPYDVAAADEHFRALSMSFLEGLGDLSLEADTPQALPVCIGTLSAAQTASSELTQRSPEARFSAPDRDPRHRDLLRMSIDSVETADGALTVLISTTNECVGHVFPSGVGIKAYLEARAFDDTGQIAGQYGGLGPDDEPVETATRLGVQNVNSAGAPITDGRFWDAVGTIFRREILPGETIRDAIRLPITPGMHAARVEGTWYYLRPERFRNRERGIQRDIPPVAIGSAEWHREAAEERLAKR
jgi:hypothetical protein